MAKLDGTNGLIQQYDYQVLTTAFSYTFAAGTQTLIINPAGTLATGTVTMPAAPADGMVIWITTTKQIVALTINGNTGQTLTSGVTSLAPNQSVAYIYRVTNTTWYPFETQMAQGNGPAFSAYQSTQQSTLTANVATLLVFQTEEFDTNGCFNNTASTVTLNGVSAPQYSFAPNVAGYYQIGGSAAVAASVATSLVYIYKNGSSFKRLINTNSASITQGGGSALVYLNGTSDYVQLYLSQNANQQLNNSAETVYFQAVMVRSA
jgi:hypothetical protein